MSTFLTIVLFLAGVGLVVFFSEKLVEGVVGTSAGFGVSAFLLSVVFLGFDPENLAVGTAGTSESVMGIALGSIIGAAMVAMGLALGITAAISPLKFQQVSVKILLLPVISVVIFFVLCLDGQLNRMDGILLLIAYAVSVFYLIWLNKKGIDVKAGGEVAETLQKEKKRNKWKSMGLFVLALGGIILGSELLVENAQTIIERSGMSDTFFGMTILAFLISIEELARELPAALKGKADISFGNVVGSSLAFFLFNAGIIALVRPVDTADAVLQFYLPVCLATILFVCIVVWLTRQLSRWAGIVLIGCYLFFLTGAYIKL